MDDLSKIIKNLQSSLVEMDAVMKSFHDAGLSTDYETLHKELQTVMTTVRYVTGANWAVDAAMHKLVKLCEKGLSTNSQVNKAIMAINTAVTELKRSLDSNEDYKIVIKFKPAIKEYIKMVKENVLPDLQKALAGLEDYGLALIDVQKVIPTLRDWCQNQKKELEHALGSGVHNEEAKEAARNAAGVMQCAVGALSSLVDATGGIVLIKEGVKTLKYPFPYGPVVPNWMEEFRKLYKWAIVQLEKLDEELAGFPNDVSRSADKIQMQVVAATELANLVERSIEDGEFIVDEGIVELIDLLKKDLETIKESCRKYLLK